MTQPDWQQLAAALRDLHRALMDRGRRDYEREHGVVVDRRGRTEFRRLCAQ